MNIPSCAVQLLPATWVLFYFLYILCRCINKYGREKKICIHVRNIHFRKYYWEENELAKNDRPILEAIWYSLQKKRNVYF